MLDAQTLYEQGIAAVKIKDFAKARQLLKASIKSDPSDERAWLWLARAVEDDDTRLKCIERALNINPFSEVALEMQRRLLAKLQGNDFSSPPVASPKLRTSDSLPAVKPALKTKSSDSLPAANLSQSTDNLTLVAETSVRNYLQVMRTLAIVLCGSFILFSLFVAHETTLERDGILLLVTIFDIMGACIVYISHRILSVHGTRIEVYEEGLRICHGDQARMIYWADIDGVTLKDQSQIITQGIIPVYYMVYYYLTLYKDNKELFVFSMDYHRYREIGMFILTRTQPVLLKKFQAELKHGNEVRVGGITFTATGLQKGRKQVNWSEIASYAPDTSAVALRTSAGKTVTFRYNAEKDQNFHILHDLVTSRIYNRNRIP